MSIIDKLKNLGRRLMGKPEPEALELLTSSRYYPSTSRERKAEARASVRYAHVAVPIIQPTTAADIEAHEKLRQLGIILPPPQPRIGKGITLHTGKGYIKREADRIARELGWNNKQRIKLRGRMQARAEELAAA